MKTYLVRFAQIREDFRLAELRAICDTVHVEFPSKDAQSYSTSSPFWIARFPDEQCVQRVLSRAILIREMVELLAHGDSMEEVVEQVKGIPEAYFAPYVHLAFRFDIDDYMRKIPMKEQVDLINHFSFLPLQGPVSMASPGVRFSLHMDATQGRVYFGRLVGGGRRDLIDRFNLKKREYLGTTSMDSELSLVMCNMAAVQAGSLVYDPFVGTGSFLCVAGFYGAFTLGSDIDGRQMRGQEGCSMRSNLQQYGVAARFVDGLVFDILQNPWRRGLKFDAIITDPPYGVRAGAKKIGTRSPYPISCSALLSGEEKALRYPKTVPYEMDELAEDLHGFAVEFLRPGGRLVYWYPVEFGEGGSRLGEEQVLAMLPRTAGLSLISLILQRCKLFDRWLVVLERE